MRTRLISACIVAILLIGICGCAQTAVDTSAAESKNVETADINVVHTETEGTKKQGIRIKDAKAECTRAEDEETENTEIEDAVTQNDLFNSQGVYIQLLAEGDEELSETDREEFLATFGFEGSEPFYVHTEEDGYPFMELYFDEEHEIGCGIRYWENDFGNVICGFAFDNCQEVSWHARDPYSVLSVYGTTGEDRVTDYQENYEYDEEGRLIGYQSTGTPTDIDGEDWKNISMITVAFNYDDQGNLREKEYWHSTTPHLPFGTTYSYQNSYYDESGRLAHTASYITHGSLEGYYIYQGDSDVPSYYLELDHQYTSWPTFYKFVNRAHNWQFDSFGRSTEAQSQNDEIARDREADFLIEQGFTEDDLFFEYAWTSGIDYRLSLYCDEYVTRGAGLVREYVDGEYLETVVFTFDGCEEYLDDAAVGQYSVYSDYDMNGRETHFLEGETIDDWFRAMELDEIHAVSFDYEDGQLVHMEQGLTHGVADRFYFFNRDNYSYGAYMLEVDYGWGATLYRF